MRGGVGGNTGANCGSWTLLTAPSGRRCDNHHHYPCLYQHRISAALKLDVLLLWLHCTFGPFLLCLEQLLVTVFYSFELY